MKKFAYTNAISLDERISLEEDVASYLFENSSLDEDEAQEVSQEITILVVSRVAPHLVVEVLENSDSF
jgi:hypothetical protein